MLLNSRQSTRHTLRQILKWMHTSDNTLQTNLITKNIDQYLCELERKQILKWQNLQQFSTGIREIDSSRDKLSSMTQGMAQGVVLVTKAVLNDWQKLNSSSILDLDVRSINEMQLNSLLKTTIEERNDKDFLYLIKECLRHKILPSNGMLLDSLRYLSELGRLEDIEAIGKICKITREDFLNYNANLEPFKAVALWQKGSTESAFNVLSASYEENQNKSSKSEQSLILIRNTFRLIIANGLSNKSEAALVLAIKTASNLYQCYHDIFMLACIWKECFISDWFLDQQTAQQLFNDYEELQIMIAKRSSNLCARLIEYHQIDAVYRLIQLLLQSNYKKSCQNCLQLFFDYQYIQSNLRACLEIVKTCHELEFTLDEIRSKQFMNLLFHKNFSKETKNDKSQTTLIKNKPAMKGFRYTF